MYKLLIALMLLGSCEMMEDHLDDLSPLPIQDKPKTDTVTVIVRDTVRITETDTVYMHKVFNEHMEMPDEVFEAAHVIFSEVTQYHYQVYGKYTIWSTLEQDDETGSYIRQKHQILCKWLREQGVKEGEQVFIYNDGRLPN